MSEPTAEPRRCSPGRSCRRFFTGAAIALLPAAISVSPISADEIYFKSGYSETAVVIREREASVTFKTEMGMSTVSREKIDFIEEATQEENRAFLKQWRKKELEREAAQEASREAKRRFEEEQIAKGLVEFEDRWMTPEEKQTIVDLRKQAREHRRRFEAEQEASDLVQFQHVWVTPEQAEELREMEPKIYNLSDEITEQRKTVNALRSAMLKVSSLEEAEKISARIEDIKQSIDDNVARLGLLLDRADEIEATSVRYVTPEQFRDALAPETESE